MAGFLAEVRETLVPSAGAKDGPLPPILVSLTVVTGLVDSFSYLVLGHVFVANMTGNVVFMAFALAGASGFSIAYSVVAISGFLGGGLAAGRAFSRLGKNRARAVWVCVGSEAVLLGTCSLAALASGSPVSGAYPYVLIVALSVAMGVQNGTARKLGVPDLTTTVLTLTLVGLAEDSTLAGGPGSKAGRRLTSVASMFLGAIMGAWMSLNHYAAYPVMVGFGIALVVAVATLFASRRSPPWALVQ